MSVVLVLLASLPGFVGEKTDTVVFQNGDHITCEIRVLQQGQLTVKTNYSRTMELDWRAVKRITSPRYFKIYLEDGRRIYGKLADPGEDGVIGVQLLDKVQRYPLDTVISLTPIEQGFFRKLSGSVSVGATALKANTQQTLNISTNTTFRSMKWYAQGNFSWYTSTAQGSPRIVQGNLGASSYRLYARRWALVSSASFARNDELDLRLRSSLAVAAGYRILDTNSKMFIAMVGLNGTEENYGSSTDEPGMNLEGVLSVSYNSFIFRKPQLTFAVNLTAYPSFTSSNRYRVAFNSHLNYEVISNFFVGFNATYSYDSQPPSTVGSQSDWALTTTVGYNFNQ